MPIVIIYSFLLLLSTFGFSVRLSTFFNITICCSIFVFLLKKETFLQELSDSLLQFGLAASLAYYLAIIGDFLALHFWIGSKVSWILCILFLGIIFYFSGYILQQVSQQLPIRRSLSLCVSESIYFAHTLDRQFSWV